MTANIQGAIHDRHRAGPGHLEHVPGGILIADQDTRQIGLAAIGHQQHVADPARKREAANGNPNAPTVAQHTATDAQDVPGAGAAADPDAADGRQESVGQYRHSIAGGAVAADIEEISAALANHRGIRDRQPIIIGSAAHGDGAIGNDRRAAGAAQVEHVVAAGRACADGEIKSAEERGVAQQGQDIAPRAIADDGRGAGRVDLVTDDQGVGPQAGCANRQRAACAEEDVAAVAGRVRQVITLIGADQADAAHIGQIARTILGNGQGIGLGVPEHQLTAAQIPRGIGYGDEIVGRISGQRQARTDEIRIGDNDLIVSRPVGSEGNQAVGPASLGTSATYIIGVVAGAVDVPDEDIAAVHGTAIGHFHKVAGIAGAAADNNRVGEIRRHGTGSSHQEVVIIRRRRVTDVEIGVGVVEQAAVRDDQSIARCSGAADIGIGPDVPMQCGARPGNQDQVVTAADTNPHCGAGNANQLGPIGNGQRIRGTEIADLQNGRVTVSNRDILRARTGEQRRVADRARCRPHQERSRSTRRAPVREHGAIRENETVVRPTVTDSNIGGYPCTGIGQGDIVVVGTGIITNHESGGTIILGQIDVGALRRDKLITGAGAPDAKGINVASPRGE